MKKISIFLLILRIFLVADDIPGETPYYNFIHYSKNHLIIPEQSDQFDSFFDSMKKLALGENKKIRIIHIGDSHIQADFISGRLREKFHSLIPEGTAERGYLFPYKIARTNNPIDYTIRYQGNWSNCKNVKDNIECELGVSGISITTHSPNSYIQFNFNNTGIQYCINKIKVFHKIDKKSFQIKLPNCDIQKIIQHDSLGYTEFFIEEKTDSIRLQLIKAFEYQNFFELYGISLENDYPGFSYSSFGINGAEVQDFLKCVLLEKHLKAMKPDLIIVSLGTNDVYSNLFKEINFQEQYQTLINRTKTASPNSLILLCSPGDHYKRRYHLNRKTLLAVNVIKNIAQKNHCAFWDFYHIMGGQNSIILWYNQGLAQRDRLHYTAPGYYLQADLLFNSLMQGLTQ